MDAKAFLIGSFALIFIWLVCDVLAARLPRKPRHYRIVKVLDRKFGKVPFYLIEERGLFGWGILPISCDSQDEAREYIEVRSTKRQTEVVDEFTR